MGDAPFVRHLDRFVTVRDLPDLGVLKKSVLSHRRAMRANDTDFTERIERRVRVQVFVLKHAWAAINTEPEDCIACTRLPVRRENSEPLTNISRSRANAG
jgi:hypothetical protein